MASITATPSVIGTGDDVVVTGEGFEPSGVVTLEIAELGIRSEITADPAGFFGTDDVADRATATLTLTDVAVADEEVVLGAVTYVWKADPGASANEVKIGDDAAECLANLKAAVNLSGTAGEEYGTATEVHPTVAAGKITATTLLFYAKTAGTGGNTLVSTETMTNGSFVDTTFEDTGSAATGVSPVIIRPEREGSWDITATDGTNSASTSVTVWTS
jgi:hypothetical protein